MSIDILKQLFERHFGAPATNVSALQGNLGASGRNILRLSGNGHRAVGILYNVREENAAFLEFSRHFRRHGLPVPEIYGEDLEHNAYLEEDLGNTTLFQFLSQNRDGENIAPEVIEAYRKSIAVLPRFQVEAGRTLDYRFAYPRASFDRQSIAWDLNYFKYYFLRLAGVDFNEQGLEDDFQSLTEFLIAADREYFLYRDFQSRNIMLRDGEPWFLDYQGGRKGASQYDIASLLFDAKADLHPTFAIICSSTISMSWQSTSRSIAKNFSATTTVMCMCASCRHLARMAFADSTNASRSSCKAFLTR